MERGERRVGKTSLANVLSDIFADRKLEHLHSVGVNCTTNDDFRSIWRNVFHELHVDLDDQWADVSPEAVRYVLQGLQHRTLIVIDEVDRLENDEALTLLSDTVKTLSDHAVGATLVLVGVADSVDELIGDHQSIERAVTQVPMPRMSNVELTGIVDKGLRRLRMTITDNAKTRIARLSEGLPQRGAGHRRHDGDPNGRSEGSAHNPDSVSASHEEPATRQSVERVLLACALAPKDELGYFTAGAVREPMTKIMGRHYEIPAFAKHLTDFTDEARGRVLQKTGRTRRSFYRFENPILQPFVILKGLSKGLITEELVPKAPRRVRGDRRPSQRCHRGQIRLIAVDRGAEEGRAGTGRRPPRRPARPPGRPPRARGGQAQRCGLSRRTETTSGCHGSSARRYREDRLLS